MMDDDDGRLTTEIYSANVEDNMEKDVLKRHVKLRMFFKMLKSIVRKLRGLYEK